MKHLHRLWMESLKGEDDNIFDGIAPTGHERHLAAMESFTSSSDNHYDSVPLEYLLLYSHIHEDMLHGDDRRSVRVYNGDATADASVSPRSAPQGKCENSSSKSCLKWIGLR